MEYHKITRQTSLIRITVCLLLFGSAVLGCKQGHVNTASLPYDTLQHLVTKHAMVSSAHPLSSDIGKAIMQKGGNAVDAAVATAFAVSVVEPEMSGLGGGGGMMIWLKDKKEAHYIDFYAAKRASTYESIDGNKEDHKLWEVGIPGEVAGLLYAQEKFGKLARKEVMEPAIKLARDGFPMYLKLAHFIETQKDILDQYAGKDLFRPNGKAFKIGEIFKQEALAASLQKIADSGVSAFYNGSIGEDIVKVLNDNGVPVTMEDFRNYKIKTDKAPLTTTYKNWTVLSAPAPQGGLEIIEDLNILEAFDLKDIGLPTQSARAFHILTGTMRAGMADRAYNKDPNWAIVPSKILTSKDYAKKRAAYALKTPTPYKIEPGHFNLDDLNSDELKTNEDVKDEHGETTSLSVVDAEGNAVALTQTLSQVFGKNGAWVDGFFLNNSGTDFTRTFLLPKSEPADEYRTRYSPIAPTIILNKDGTVKLVIGSPGGGRISTRIVQNIIYMLDYGMDPMVAARMQRIYPSPHNNTVRIQTGFNGKVLEEERRNEYYFNPDFGPGARIYSILRKDGYWIGAADPLHQGGVSGY